ncbi:MAG: M48 family metalloprotease [Micrococcales bacterium]|nr:M48 family metalloprotease [Micrococcales bacterium]
MLETAAALTVIAVLLAWPVPMLLARAAWPARAPATALVAWQAIALAGGLAMIGAPLSLAVAGYGDDLVRGLAGLVRAIVAGRAPASAMVLLAVAALLGLWLVGHLVVTLVQVARQRRRHAVLLQLLSSAHPTRAGARVIEGSAPVAYCLPRGSGSATVLSRGLLDLLDADELDAVVHHEDAHVRQRHDILLVAFRAWHSALPRFPVAALAEGRVAELVEMLADDRARRSIADAVLARAIHRVGEVGSASSAAAAARRAARLSAPPLAASERAAVVLGSVALVTVPTLWIALPALAGAGG